jgi:DNA-binding NarL/FixJ family response regulator
MTRIVIADDHAIVREGLKQVLANAGDFTVVAEAQNGREVLERVRELEFDVLLLDMSMPGKSGIELIKQVHAEKPRLRILVLSMHEEQQYAVRALKAGAAGYLTKESASHLLIKAIRKVAGGGAYITPEVAEQFALGAMAESAGPRHAVLSDREYQVFEMLAAGVTINDIADRLNLSAKTVSTHKARIMQKMNMTNPAEMIRYAINHHLIDDPDRQD